MCLTDVLRHTHIFFERRLPVFKWLAIFQCPAEIHDQWKVVTRPPRVPKMNVLSYRGIRHCVSVPFPALVRTFTSPPTPSIIIISFWNGLDWDPFHEALCSRN